MHEHYEHSEFLTDGPWLVIGLVAGLIVLGAILWFFLRDRLRPPAGPVKSDVNPLPAEPAVAPQETAPVEAGQRQSLSGVAGEIFDMLRLHGGRMTQLEIAKDLGVDQEEIAEPLDMLEARGCIERRWDGEKKTFGVAASQG